jgi:MerR family transcriptional regulator, copper efflux regulator
MTGSMSIGALAKQAGLSVETLRFYEREGLLEKAARNRSGYRAYGPDASRRLQFIRRAQDLGFTLAEIRELIALQANPANDCRDACTAATAKLAAVEAKLSDLERMRAELTRLINSCNADVPVMECAIIECLTEPNH